MKDWSIKRKLTTLSLFLLGLILMIGSVGLYGKNLLHKSLADIDEVQLPAVHKMTLVDMMHDGLRAVAYRALYVAQANDNEGKKEVAEELKEMTENMDKYIAEIDLLPTGKETKEAIQSSMPEIKKYEAATEEIVGLALAGRREAAEAKLPDFQKAFTDLEEKLEKLGGMIEQNAGTSHNEAVAATKKTTILIVGMMLFGLIGGALISYFIISSLMQALSKTIGQLSATSDEVSSASSGTAASATELSEASTQQASSLQETMASVEQISAMVNQNAESATKVKSAVETNRIATDEGTKSVHEMLGAITEIKDTNNQILNQMESSNKEFAAIVKIISEIGEKTKVINDIVFQTKLLSFNASVEAARAGEHGKGFAVVAEEVGNLAQMSGNAAKEIGSMLSDSIKKVNEIVAATTQRVDQLVEVGKDKIAMGQSTAQKCQGALERVSENAKTVASMVNEIAQASKEQAQGVQEINKAISQLDQVTHQNSAVAQQSSSQAEQLKAEALSLADIVARLELVTFGEGHVRKNDFKSGGKKVRRATPPPQNNVVSLETHKADSTTASSNGIGVKMASGSNLEVPSADDPNFENF